MGALLLIVGIGTLLARPCPAAEGFAWLEEDGALRLTWDGRPVLQYNVETVAPPEGVGAAFARNAYIHPVWNPQGQVVTDDFPPDHYHQRGIFFAWTKTEFGDLHPDFWNLGQKLGRIVFEALEERAVSAQGARLVVRHRWEASRGEEWVPVLRETWTLTVHSPEGPDPDAWVMDLDVQQVCATDTPLVLPKYFYGGMAYRGCREWLEHPERVVVATSEGLDRPKSNETNARWCFMGGELEGGFGGVTVMDHPANVRFPNRLRVHPKVPYLGYILPQTEAFTIEPGTPLNLRYRIVVHGARPFPEDLDQLHTAFGAE